MHTTADRTAAATDLPPPLRLAECMWRPLATAEVERIFAEPGGEG